MSILVITGDLLNATEKYILHQTNCISQGAAAGIARAIFDKYPYADCYSNRKERSIPGTFDIMGNGLDQRFVINLHSQKYPGGPNIDSDNQEARQKYFYRGLLRLAKVENLESIAINWKIGCGIAGGNWDYYLGTLTNFAKYIKEKQNAEVVIYRREGDE